MRRPQFHARISVYFTAIICFASALAALATSVWVFLRWGQSFVSLTLVVGMVLAALEACFSGMVEFAHSSEDLLRWQYLAVLATSVQPGVWLLFAMTFERAGYEQTLQRCRWRIAAVFVFPLALAILLGGELFRSAAFIDGAWVVGLSWAGKVFHLFLLLCAVTILMCLERTFRASAGAVRWEIKFLILGVGAFWATRVYASSQTLLFSMLYSELASILFAVLFVACLMMATSLWRTRVLAPALYVSQDVVYNSLIAFVVGAYLILVGILAKLTSYVGQGSSVPLESFVLFIALIALSVLLLSDELRHRTKKLVARALNRPQFDYRKVWGDFTRETSALLDEHRLAASVAGLLARTFGVSAAGIWLWNDERRTLELLHGTFQAEYSNWSINQDVLIESLVLDHNAPCELGGSREGWPGLLGSTCPEELFPVLVKYATPLLVKEKFLGFVTMNEKLTGEPLSSEELDLFRTLSEQTAASLLNLELLRDLTAAHEAETFQRVSTFLVHDLKNLAAGLSLTVNNFPRHFDNPNFRADALKTIAQTAEKMNVMCHRLGSLETVPSLALQHEDLNSLVESTLSDLNGIRPFVQTELHEVAPVFVDAEEIKKVFQNLILNAVDASEKEGSIAIGTDERGDATVVSVSDNGCGMSREFIDNKLFRPFSSTKKNGLGIGLFQSKQIVEAHKGKLEVESEEGKGSTFRVYLPAAGKSNAR